MNIGKVAKLSNLTIKAVRYYDNVGLVQPKQNILSDFSFKKIFISFIKLITPKRW